MKSLAVTLLVALIGTTSFSQIKVEDYYKEAHKSDWSIAFNEAFKALEKAGHGSVDLVGTKTYTFYKHAELPRYSSQKGMFVINGNGATIVAKIDSVNIFNRIPKDQKEASSKMVKSRFTINDISFVGGAKGINLGATYQSSINRCNFQNQKVAAMDIQFGLHTSIYQCNSTNAIKDAFVLRTGADWGGNSNNSQSNHSVINMCRVYARKGANSSFKVLGSGGVVLRDIISEGSKEVNYSVFVDRLTSTTVRQFKIENFHLEHAPIKAAIYLRSSGISTIDGLFYQLSRSEFVLIETGDKADQITLKNVPHFVGGTIIKQSHGGGGASWLLESCRKEFFDKKNWRVKGKSGYEQKLPYYFKGTGYRFHTKKAY